MPRNRPKLPEDCQKFEQKDAAHGPRFFMSAIYIDGPAVRPAPQTKKGKVPSLAHSTSKP